MKLHNPFSYESDASDSVVFCSMLVASSLFTIAVGLAMLLVPWLILICIIGAVIFALLRFLFYVVIGK